MTTMALDIIPNVHSVMQVGVSQVPAYWPSDRKVTIKNVRAYHQLTFQQAREWIACHKLRQKVEAKKARTKKFPVLTTVNTVTPNNLHTFFNTQYARANGRMYAFKYSRLNGTSPQHNTTAPYLVCAEDKFLHVSDASTDWGRDCAKGVNIATYDWCMQDSRMNGYKLWLVEFSAINIAVVPRDSNGKFRVFKCRVVREIKSKPVIYTAHSAIGFGNRPYSDTLTPRPWPAGRKPPQDHPFTSFK